MNKLEFIQKLKAELLANQVPDIEEIIADFEEHFAYKLEEGKTEAEILRKIGNPSDIARDYQVFSKPEKESKKGFIRVWLIFMDMFVALSFLLFWISVLVLGVFTVTLFVLGILLLTSLNIMNIIPPMPYLGSFLLALSIFGLTVVSGIGTFYLGLYVIQWQKVYIRYRKNLLNNFIYPPLSMHPKLSKKVSSKLKLLNMLGIVVLVAAFTLGYLVNSLFANSFEFWHVWGWFVS